MQAKNYAPHVPPPVASQRAAIGAQVSFAALHQSYLSNLNLIHDKRRNPWPCLEDLINTVQAIMVDDQRPTLFQNGRRERKWCMEFLSDILVQVLEKRKE